MCTKAGLKDPRKLLLTSSWDLFELRQGARLLFLSGLELRSRWPRVKAPSWLERMKQAGRGCLGSTMTPGSSQTKDHLHSYLYLSGLFRWTKACSYLFELTGVESPWLPTKETQLLLRTRRERSTIVVLWVELSYVIQKQQNKTKTHFIFLSSQLLPERRFLTVFLWWSGCLDLPSPL